MSEESVDTTCVASLAGRGIHIEVDTSYRESVIGRIEYYIRTKQFEDIRGVLRSPPPRLRRCYYAISKAIDTLRGDTCWRARSRDNRPLAGNCISRINIVRIVRCSVPLVPILTGSETRVKLFRDFNIRYVKSMRAAALEYLPLLT